MSAVAELLASLPGVPALTDPAAVRRASRDMSAVLSPQLAAASAELLAEAVVAPRDEDEVMQVVAACATHRVPLVPRAAGSCNFGQGIPLRGGVVLDLTGLTGLVRHEPGRWRARGGTVLAAVDDALSGTGEELRIFPSSKKVGTAGGFVNGGHAGIGAIRYGVLADPGNILGLRVVTVEEAPRVLELGPADAQLVHFSFGTAGIVTEVEMPTTMAWAWRDVVVTHPTVEHALAFGQAVAFADGIDVKVVHPVDPDVAASFTPLGIPAGAAATIAMVAPHSLVPFGQMAGEHGGAVHLDVAQGRGPRHVPAYEYTWGHSVWWLRRRVPGVATLLALLPDDDPVAALTDLRRALAPRVWTAVSIKRFGGRPAFQVSLCVDGADPAQLSRAADLAVERGCLVADTHRPVMSAGSLYGLQQRQRAFVADVDPLGLLNPGKVDTAPGALPSTGFAARGAGDR